MTKFNEDMKRKLMELRGQGLGSKRIAKELGISSSTATKWAYMCGVGGVLPEYKMSKENKKIYNIVCKACNKEYQSRYETTKFCCDACRSKYNKENKGHKQVCKYCKGEFRVYRKQNFCTKECWSNYAKVNKKPKAVIKKKHKEKNCIGCGISFTTTRGNKKYCNKDCAYKHHLNKLDHKRKEEVTYHQRKCKECGKHFSSTRWNAAYCNTVCSNRYSNRRNETTRRRMIRKNGKVDWNISIERLLKRDGKRCYLCDANVDLSVDTNHANYPSIEHVIPVSKGGTHTWDNVKIAHRKCNALKSDKTLDEVLGK
ncbi:MAG: HNH endonuclease [Bacillota bacterium]